VDRKVTGTPAVGVPAGTHDAPRPSSAIVFEDRLKVSESWAEDPRFGGRIMNIIRTRTTKLVLSLALLSALPGCVLAAVGAGAAALGIVYIQGEHQLDVAATPSEAVVAASATVEAHGFIFISSDSDELSGEVVARTVNDSMVRVRMQRLASGHSRVWVRIGALGKSAVSKELLMGIKERLEFHGPQKAPKPEKVAANNK
jgi:hypothetical protein